MCIQIVQVESLGSWIRARHSEGNFEGAGIFTDNCPEAQGIREVYSALPCLTAGFRCVCLTVYWCQCIIFAKCSCANGCFSRNKTDASNNYHIDHQTTVIWQFTMFQRTGWQQFRLLKTAEEMTVESFPCKTPTLPCFARLRHAEVHRITETDIYIFF